MEWIIKNFGAAAIGAIISFIASALYRLYSEKVNFQRDLKRKFFERKVIVAEQTYINLVLQIEQYGRSETLMQSAKNIINHEVIKSIQLDIIALQNEIKSGNYSQSRSANLYLNLDSALQISRQEEDNLILSISELAKFSAIQEEINIHGGNNSISADLIARKYDFESFNEYVNEFEQVCRNYIAALSIFKKVAIHNLDLIRNEMKKYQ